MKSICRCTFVSLAAAGLLVGPVRAAEPAKSSAPSPVLAAAKLELDRNFAELKKQPVPAYFMSYEIVDTSSVTVASSFGALVHTNAAHRRIAHIDLRVGDYALDNTHQIRSRVPAVATLTGMVVLPVEDDPLPIRQALWLDRDRQYKRALTQFAAVQTNAQVQLAQENWQTRNGLCARRRHSSGRFQWPKRPQ